MWNSRPVFDAPFNTSAQGGGFGNTTMSTQGGKKETVRKAQSVVPLVIRQILANDAEDFRLYDNPVQIAHLVGILRNFEVQSTKASCVIEDHTGSIKAHLWLDTQQGDDHNAPLPQVKEGCYVQVYGSLRNQSGEKLVVILKMSPLDDCNVITNHLLQVMYVKYAAKKRLEQAKDPAWNPGAALARSMSAINDSTNIDGGALNAANTTLNTMGLNSMQERIFRIVRPAEGSGISVNAIVANFKPHQQREVMNNIEFLVNEGIIYSTIDTEHYRATDIGPS